MLISAKICLVLKFYLLKMYATTNRHSNAMHNLIQFQCGAMWISDLNFQYKSRPEFDNISLIAFVVRWSRQKFIRKRIWISGYPANPVSARRFTMGKIWLIEASEESSRDEFELGRTSFGGDGGVGAWPSKVIRVICGLRETWHVRDVRENEKGEIEEEKIAFLFFFTKRKKEKIIQVFQKICLTLFELKNVFENTINLWEVQEVERKKK